MSNRHKRVRSASILNVQPCAGNCECGRTSATTSVDTSFSNLLYHSFAKPDINPLGIAGLDQLTKSDDDNPLDDDIITF